MRYCFLEFVMVTAIQVQMTGLIVAIHAWQATNMPELLLKPAGAMVTKVKVGDKVGVGFFIDSCLDCKMCRKGEENYCEKGLVGTFNGRKSHGRVAGNKELRTFGGYAASNVVHQHFVMKIPDAIPLKRAAPLLCAGICTIH